MLTLDGISLQNKRVLIREDFNVPLEAGTLRNTARIEAALPGLRRLLDAKARVMVVSHLGRPKGVEAAFSLAPVARYLAQRLHCSVPLIGWEDPVPWPAPSEIGLFENVRFLAGEEENSTPVAKRLGALCDVFVMDAFGCAHRAHASTYGVMSYAPLSVGGPLLVQELAALEAVLADPRRPVVAIVGGSKVSTKLEILTHVLEKVDILIVGGGIANTFLAARHYPVGQSLYEADQLATARALWERANVLKKTLWIPEDVIVASDLNGQPACRSCDAVGQEEAIFDIGPQSQKQVQKLLRSAKTILWNGPMGVFEKASFAEGTQALARSVAESAAFSVAGGGDTLRAIEQFGVKEHISYLSTGGGAFLEAIEGKVLPCVAMLQSCAKEHAFGGR